MKRTNLFLIGILCLSLTLVTFPNKASAHPSSIPHYTKSELIYEIDENLTIHAQLNFTLAAPKSPGIKYWTCERSRTIPTPDVTDIQKDDPKGRVNLKIRRNQNSTTLQIDFKIYPDERLDYNISYRARGLASKDGPKCQLTTPLGSMSVGRNGCPHDNFSVAVHGPPRAKLFTYKPIETVVIGENLSYGNQIEKSTSFPGILGTWYQSPTYYELTFTENIVNTSSKETTDFLLDLAIFNIGGDWGFPALIETTGPLESIYVDEENNWLGAFRIETIHPGGNREFQVKLVYQARVHDPDLKASNVGDLSKIPTELDPYLEALDYWPVDNLIMQQAAEIAVDGESNSYIVAKNIVEFVGERLEYEIQPDRLGALQAYIERKGDCSEYTDLSITLARAAGLPARACYGWGYRENELVGHAWPEFFFPNAGWQPADPTWVDTGGIVLPGGLQLVPHSPGREFGELAPTLAGTSGSYLARLDAIHLLRSRGGLDSTEPYILYEYLGGKPTVEESKSVSLITEAEAANKFISAAELVIDRATNLLAAEDGREDLIQELNLAQNLLDEAENETSVEQKLSLSQESLRHSSKVIKALGKRPQTREGWRLPEIPLTFLGIGLTLGVALAGLGYFIKRRS